MSDGLIENKNSFLVIVDVQEKLAPAISGIDQIVRCCRALLQAADLLEVPVIFTEHCPDRIGHTLVQLLHAAPKAARVSKRYFGSLAECQPRDAFLDLAPRRPIVCGTEAHVCVLQTVFGLLGDDFEPIIVADAVGSRKSLDKETALQRMQSAGASLVTSEMVLFEWMQQADHPRFRELLSMIKAL